MRYYRALIIFLVAAIVTASGCVEFGATPYTPTPVPTPTPFVIPGAIGLVPGNQVNATLLQPISHDRTANMTQAENLTLTLKNHGASNVTNVYFSIKVKDGQTSESLYNNMVAIGNITPGGTAKRTLALPPHKFIYFIVVQVTVYWGDNLEFGNELRPWYISL